MLSIIGNDINRNMQKSSKHPVVSEQAASKRIRKSGTSFRIAHDCIGRFLVFWYLLTITKLFPAYALPTPRAVWKSFLEEIREGRLVNDVIASLWRVAVGFVFSAILGIPAGLWLGQHLRARQAFVPMLNFFRFLSPLAWIPFAILWFHLRQASDIPDF
jgi:ABC-type nitrate/sulfonate/bicarbonate transport system permease component